MPNNWQPEVGVFNESGSGAGALQRLRDDSAAVIVLRKALDGDDLSALATEVSRRRAEATVSTYSNGTLTTFGCYLARHLREPETYFARASSGDDLFATQRHDLRATVRQQLSTFLELRELAPAQEPNGQLYAPAIVRVHGDGVSNPLHNDNIMRDAARSGLIVSRLRYQFSCVTCIQECSANGELLHYRRRWEPTHEQFKVEGGLGYREEVVNGAELCRFRPETGDIYLIDPTNFHAIRAVTGRDRITLGFFFGFFDAEFRDAVYWS
jgi:hypothetical protein